MTTIREFTDPVQAGLVLSVLQDNEIDATLFDQGASAWTAGRLLVPIRLVVPPDQAGAALDILKRFESPLTKQK